MACWDHACACGWGCSDNGGRHRGPCPECGGKVTSVHDEADDHARDRYYEAFPVRDPEYLTDGDGDESEDE